MEPIKVDNLTKRFGRLTALEELSFSVRAGTITGFLGPNGAGKTTTIRCLLGLSTPTAGAATIYGRPYRQLRAPVRTVGALLDDAGYHPSRSARSHLWAAATAAGIPSSRVDEMLQTVGLTGAARRRVGGYSGGMRRRLGLAAAGLGGPSVLVLDEPANGLDPDGVHWLRDLLRSFADKGGAVLVSSHMLDEVAQVADDVVIIAHGRCVASSSMEDLMSQASSATVVRTASSEAAGKLLALIRDQGVDVTAVGPNRLRVAGRSSRWVGETAAANGLVLEELSASERRLEDVFMHLTRRDQQ